MTLFDRCEHHLRSLGNTAVAVRDSLVKLDIRGNHRMGSCPLANFIKKSEPMASPRVGSTTFNVHDDFWGHTNPLPGVSQKFVAAFDAKLFPELESNHDQN